MTGRSSERDLLRRAPFIDVRISDNGLVAECGGVTLASAGDEELQEFCSALCAAIARPRHFARRLDLVRA